MLALEENRKAFLTWEGKKEKMGEDRKTLKWRINQIDRTDFNIESVT